MEEEEGQVHSRSAMRGGMGGMFYKRGEGKRYEGRVREGNTLRLRLRPGSSTAPLRAWH